MITIHPGVYTQIVADRKAAWMIASMFKAVSARLKRHRPPQGAGDRKQVSDAPEILTEDVGQDAYLGWHHASVAAWQNTEYQKLLDRMYRGDIRLDLKIAAEAVAETGLAHPRLLEVGCGSGYYNEILNHLRGPSLAYTGLDYSRAMIELAVAQYPETHFVQGDATGMEFADNSFDIVMNGAALMHIPAYESAISESRRVSNDWCIFHTIPVVEKRPTTVLKKRAYGEEVVEITFNNRDLESIFHRNGLVMRKTFESIPHDYLDKIMGERVAVYTFLLQKA